MTGRGKGGSGSPEAPRGRRVAGFVAFSTFTFLILLFVIVASPLMDAQARDAAFIDPGSAAGMAAGDDAVKVEGNMDIGDSALNVARHTDLFFVNQSGGAVKVEKVAV